MAREKCPIGRVVVLNSTKESYIARCFGRCKHNCVKEKRWVGRIFVELVTIYCTVDILHVGKDVESSIYFVNCLKSFLHK